MMTATQQKLITAITITGLLAVWVIAHNLVSTEALEALFEPMRQFCGINREKAI